MQELLQAILEDDSIRQPGAASIVASAAATEFTPWATDDIGG